MHPSLPPHLSLSPSFCSFHKPAPFCLLPPRASRLNPSCSPPLLGWNFLLHSITHVSSRQLPPWGCDSTPGGVTRAQGKWAPFSLFRHTMGYSLAVFGFKLPSKSLLVLTSCQGTSSLATWLFSPVFKEKNGYSESLKNPPSLSIVQSQQDSYQTKNLKYLPLLSNQPTFAFLITTVSFQTLGECSLSAYMPGWWY